MGPSVDLSAGQLFLSRFPDGWRVWFQYHRAIPVPLSHSGTAEPAAACDGHEVAWALIHVELAEQAPPAAERGGRPRRRAGGGGRARAGRRRGVGGRGRGGCRRRGRRRGRGRTGPDEAPDFPVPACWFAAAAGVPTGTGTTLWPTATATAVPGLPAAAADTWGSGVDADNSGDATWSAVPERRIACGKSRGPSEELPKPERTPARNTSPAISAAAANLICANLPLRRRRPSEPQLGSASGRLEGQPMAS
jgi:hypothetical protein